MLYKVWNLNQEYVKNLSTWMLYLSNCRLTSVTKKHLRGTSRIPDMTFNRFAAKSNGIWGASLENLLLLDSLKKVARRQTMVQRNGKRKRKESRRLPRGANAARGTRTPGYPKRKSRRTAARSEIFRDTIFADATSSNLFTGQSDNFFLLPLFFLIARYHVE